MSISAPIRFIIPLNPFSLLIRTTSYYVATRENPKAPGGYEHSGAFILVDGQGHIRGVYNGTEQESVDKLIRDIKTLLAENAQ